MHHGEKRRYPEQNHRQRRSARYGAGQYGHEADLQRFVFREINGQHPAHHHQQHHHQAVAPDIPAAAARQIIRIYLPKGKQKNRQPRNGDGGRIYPQLFFVHSRFPPGAGLRHHTARRKSARFLTPQGGAADSHIPYINISQMTHTSAVNSKKQGGRQGSGKQAVSGRSSTYLTQKKAPLARTKEHREARANRIFFITDIASLRYSALRYPGMLYPLRCAGPPLFTKGKRPRFTPPCGAERKACGLPRSIRCVPQHCRGLHLKMRCQAGVGPSRRLYTCATTIPCPASVTASTLANSKQVSPAARFTAASAASETHRRRQKAYSRFRRGRYTCRSRAPALPKQTHARPRF